MESYKKNQRDQNEGQEGFLSVEFLFSIVVTFGCIMLLLRFTVSLVSAQMAQYIVFAAARAHAASDITADDQKDAGENKYRSLVQNRKLLAGFFNPGSQMQPNNVIGNYDLIYNPDPSSDGTSESGLPFVGARTQIKLSRMGFSVPFLGATGDGGNEFTSFVTAMIFREPSQDECRRFFESNNRYQTLLQKDSRYRQAASGLRAYVALEDSGC